MARTRSGADLIDDAMKRADVEGDDDRHPRDEVLRYINQGRAERYDIMVAALGKSYFRAPTPWTFTTARNTTLYTAGFPPTFYRLISVRISCADGRGSSSLEQTQPLEEPMLLEPGSCGWPTHYDLRPVGIEIYPRHTPGLVVTVEWIPCITNVIDDAGSPSDGVNGWEEYEVCFAARCIALKDEEYQTAQTMADEMMRLGARIKGMAAGRDSFRPRRVQDVRGARMFGRMRSGR